MWPFTKPKPDENTLQRVQSLEGKVDQLSRDLKGVVVEWNDMYEKFARLHARLVKRVKDDELAAAAATRIDQDAKTRGGQGLDTPPINPAAQRLLNGGGLGELLSR